MRGEVTLFLYIDNYWKIW